jgi:hypothetical protein
MNSTEDIVMCALDSEDSYNLLFTGPPASALYLTFYLVDALLVSDLIMVISTSTSSTLNFSTSSILFFISVFVSSTSPIGASLILFEIILDETNATSVHIIPIAANIKNDEISLPNPVTG